MENEKNIVKLPHHERLQLCTTRPPYRQGRKLTAVKVPGPRIVYTINEESQHLIIRGVPSLNLLKELKHLCMRYGEVKIIHQLKNYSDSEVPFTDVFHVLFAKIQSARFAKHMIDDRSFFGGILHVCYAPELETIYETRYKLNQRREDVLKRIQQEKDRERKLQIRGQTLFSQTYNGNRPGPSNYSIEQSSAQTQLITHNPICDMNISCTPSIQTTFPQAGVTKCEFIPKKTDSFKKGICKRKSNVTCSTTKTEISGKVVEKVISCNSKFIPRQVKRIKFNST